MSRPDALAGLRIGCVQYLNSRPLIHGLDEVVLAHPSELAARLRSGELDAALVPVFELLRSPLDYQLVEGIAIASRGPVYSVFVAHRGPVEELRVVTADPASLTSIHLFRVLSAGVLGGMASLVPETPGALADPRTGRLLIGNQAIQYRVQHESGGELFWDLGEAWTRWTGLPFVYAVWVLRRGLPRVRSVADAFREVASDGRGALARIAREDTEFGEALALRYLRENICFDLGAEERQGLERFRSELWKGGMVAVGGGPLDFV